MITIVVLATTSIWSCSYYFFFVVRTFEVYCLRAFIYMIQYYCCYYNRTGCLVAQLC